LYDFFPVCERFNLCDEAGRYCDLPCVEQCDECLASAGLPAGTQACRRRLMCEVFESVDRIRFLSESHRSLVERVLPVPVDKVIVQGLGTPFCDTVEQPAPPPPLRVVVLGNLAANKGATTILSVIRRLASERMHFTLAGTIRADVHAAVRRLNRANVTVHGGYEPEELGAILEGQHVALFASPWPETYVIALSEAFRAGVVPVVPDIGAFSERVQDGQNGLVVRGETGSFVRALLSLLDDPRLLGRLREQALTTPVTTIEDNLSLARGVYNDLAAQYELPWDAPPAVVEADLLAPISTWHFATAVGYNPPPKPTALQKVLRIYRAYGAQETARRVWARMWQRSA
jgi:glycosyltransferase involved in cell wall biosynthesis